MKLHIPPALKHRRFLYLWSGLMISVAGSRMQVWTLFWHINTITEAPLALGMVGAARIFPIILFSLIGGVAADRFNRRKILFVTQYAQVIIALMLGILSLLDLLELWQIYAITALQAVAFSFELPARQALVPNLVPRKDLPNAFGLQSIAYQVGSITGPALSGLVIANLDISYAYILNAISFGAVILALFMMGDVVHDRISIDNPKDKPKVNQEAIRAGLRFTFGNPIILSSMILDFIATFFAKVDTLMPIFAREVLKVGPIEYGWLSAAPSIGAAVAAIILTQIKGIKRQGPILLISVILFGVFTMIFGASKTFWLSILALMGAGASDTVSSVIRNTIRQLQTPDELRGRMTSINQIFFMGGPQLGEIEAGLVGQYFGVSMAALSGGAACIVGVGWIAKRWPQLVRYDNEE